VAQRGLVSGVLGVCVPVASVSGTFIVTLFTGNQLAMFAIPCAIGGVFILLFATTLDDRRLAAADRPGWSMRELVGTLYVSPRANPDFAWAFGSRIFFVMAYAFLTAYQAYYLIEHLGSSEAAVPHQIFLATVAQSTAVVIASVTGGRLSDRIGRRKVFVVTGAVVYGIAMFAVAQAQDFSGFLLGVALGGLGFGVYVAHSSPMCSAAIRTRRRTLACSTSPTRCRTRSRPRLPPPSWPRGTVATGCCSRPRAPARSLPRSRSCR
jgi:MFS family permease